ncbi:hypothetical protein FAES_1254 [Fibrella aestuarina BUZ 2]|uniref:Uncharacterized protein n=1 Tax=Fibrella aestuarina BUZ 2 TaxID=1166018 RepID=I0K561_9BACT|nr:hypothetical protein FAES_1254 [Fibrella aestuarina BUZ 2]
MACAVLCFLPKTRGRSQTLGTFVTLFSGSYKSVIKPTLAAFAQTASAQPAGLVLIVSV